MPAVPSPPRGVSGSDPFPPDCAEKFAPVRLLASGGFGTVHLAVQRSLGRQVAIKLLHADVLCDAEQVQRFNAEARITAALVHPHIVQVLDHGADSGIPWIAYEYVAGRSLRQLLDAAPGGLDLETALAASIQAAGALETAHALGVIHRDVKPDNVLEAEPRRFKVTDFGIAKWARDTAVKTRTGVVLGTPAYVAPEQILGETATPATDVYALGVMVFELVTGRLPYEHDHPVQLLEQHVRAPIPRLSDRKPGLPEALDRVLARALAKSPGDRHGSAGELADALARIARARSAAAPREAGTVRGRGSRGLFAALIAGSAAAMLVLHGAGKRPPTSAPSASPTAGRSASASIETEAVRLIRLAGDVHAHEPTDVQLFSVTREEAVELMRGQTARLAGVVSATTPWLRTVMHAPALDGDALLRSQEALQEIVESSIRTLRHAQWGEAALGRRLPLLPEVAAGFRRLHDALVESPADARREALAIVFAPEAEALAGRDIEIAPLRRAALSEHAAGLLVDRSADATGVPPPHARIARIFFLARAVDELRAACNSKDRSTDCGTALARVVRAQVELAASWPEDAGAIDRCPSCSLRAD